MKRIPLTQGQFALVDDADFEWINQWKWCAVKKGKLFYARRGTNKEWPYMHIVILGRKGIDHIDGNSLNNQRNNLRLSTKSQNGCNRGPNKSNRVGFKGVSWWKHGKIFRARIHTHRKEIHLGFFKDPKVAALAYDAAAVRFHGEFAKTNQSLGLITL